ncbi:uncharacterized protein B0H18DRAFT_326852 [Fomitopsis serialis]|uniref:uncharacterized protein n=1 Tax=Fomitopsis serialis TaxID=139415 RepID=UPI0020082135|nr:uncharacterized protein B0H18DRAFT_326852 [Neoantrodia serialis]KAH9936577.1 hypothetical protein B0H18DRAFT_326852 [Neoantrodia serialis]
MSVAHDRQSQHVPGTILAALCRTSGPVGAFHWLVYLCPNTEKGVIFHASRPVDGDRDSDQWRFFTSEWDPFTSQSCLTLALIGRVDNFDPGHPSRSVDAMRECLQAIPMVIPPQDTGRELMFTCRVWFREALRRLNAHEAFSMIMGPEEMMESLRNRTIAVQYMNPGKQALPVFLQLRPRSAYRTM